MHYLNTKACRAHSDCDSLIREMFQDDYVGTHVNWNDPMDYETTKDLFLNTDLVHGLEVDGRLVAIADCYPTQQGICVNIFVGEQYRGRGYGYQLGKHLFDQGLADTWLADTTNVGSIILARKLGLVAKTYAGKFMCFQKHSE